MINQDMNQVFTDKVNAKSPILSKDQSANGQLLPQVQTVKEARAKPQFVAKNQPGQKKTKKQAVNKNFTAEVGVNKAVTPLEDVQKDIVYPLVTRESSPSKKVATSNATMTDTERRQQAFKLRSLSGSFLVSSAIQRAPFSNSNKQVHLKLIQVDSFVGVSNKVAPNDSKAKPIVSREPHQIKLDVPEEEEDPFMTRLKRDYPQIMSRKTSSSSCRYSALSQPPMNPPLTYLDGQEEFDSDNCSFQSFRVDQEIQASKSVRRSVFLSPAEARNIEIGEVITKSQLVISESQRTLQKAEKVCARKTDLIGSATNIELQLERMACLVTQISQGLGPERISQSTDGRPSRAQSPSPSLSLFEAKMQTKDKKLAKNEK